ncbi:Gfo/Idh/MocA family protein [Cellulomonas sp. KRMCY2]|uniref:Gfo/Idh/MocA family protein n=1 Tax=Cellulomonas sp. KRMCY2 TaxID=1304865 RepID=UPI0004B22629|nr:Gfo/Idh/MocA family oxidoreductase [Cellulomonas sp. KRMCY2]
MTKHPRHGPPAPSVALVGIHGHGRSHLVRILRSWTGGDLRLTALVDPRPLGPDAVDEVTAASGAPTRDLATDLATVPWYPDLGAMLAAGAAPDVVVLCTPIHTHGPLATRALQAGCDVLLEKPPAASLGELDRLLAAESATGRVVQVGFQTFGSAALAAIDEIVAAGEIGELTGVGAVGTWVRTTGYWTRSSWTGRRSLGGRPVVDGVVTNPLAHAVVTALRLAGARTVDDVASVDLDQYRANPIEVDDTSVVRVTTSRGIPVTAALTLCAATQTTPHVTVQGSRGQVVLDYYADIVEVTGTAGIRTITAGRTDLLTNLLRHRSDPSVALLCPLRDTGAFTRVLDAVRAGPDPTRIDPGHITAVTDDTTTSDDGTHLVVRDVDRWCARAAAEHATFAELGAPWARPAAGTAG